MALAVLALLVPSVGFGDQLPAPLEKKINAGSSTIQYMGQTIRFTTPVALLVKCDPESTVRFRMVVAIYPGTPYPGGQGTNAVEPLNIYWSNIGTDVYDGNVPTGELTTWLNTEGGFVDR